MENEVIKRLNELVEKGFSKRELEIDLGIPKNNLSSYLSGFKKIPQKYYEKILGYNSMTRKELMLINEALTKEVEALKQFIKDTNPILSQNKPVEGNVLKTKESGRNVAQNKSDVKIQDLTNQSQTNYSIDTTDSGKVSKQRNAFMSDAIKKKLGL